jgi:hypothetical protein
VNRNQVLWLVVIAGVALWLWKSGKVSKEPSPSTAPVASAASSGSAPGFAGEACMTAVEQASRRVQEAATVFARTPIDPAAFASESDGASSAISSADGKCGGGGSTAEQRAMEEARGALAEMRALLADLSGALSGNGSASDAPRRQETIDRHLDAARLALRG